MLLCNYDTERRDKMDLLQIPRMIDISGVRADVSIQEVDQIARVAMQFRFIVKNKNSNEWE